MGKENIMARSMFERYGGFATVSKIVMSFYGKVLDSDIIGDYFEDVDMPALMDHQTKFIAQAMGGPAAYSNEMLYRVHKDLDIDNRSFQEMVSVLRETLEEFELERGDIEHILNDVRSRAQYIIAE